MWRFLALALILCSCVPRPSGDAEYLAAYAQAPRLNLACVGESGRPGPGLEFGANTCTLVVYPTEAKDAIRAEHSLTIFYRVNTGNILVPRIENRTREIRGEAPLASGNPAVSSFPMYVPDRDFFRQAGRIFESTFKVVLSLAPAALGGYLGVPIPAIGLDKTTSGLYRDVSNAINDLVNLSEEPYALEVGVRVCGPRLCSPVQSKALRFP